MRDEGGWALVSVLWVITALAMMAAATEMLTVTGARLEARAEDSARASALLDAAVAEAAAGIEDPRIDRRWRVDGAERIIDLDGIKMSVSVQDEFGKIDLNMADGSLIRQLLQTEGLSLDEAQSLTDKILDWRDSSGRRRLHGANAADYRKAGYLYHPRNGPFRAVAELRLVMGMTPALFAKLAPALTVYSHSPAIDPATAPKDVLLAYDNGDTGRTENILQARNAGMAGIINPQVPLAGRSFEVMAELVLDHKRFRRDAVIELTNDPRNPYLVLLWN